MKKKFVSIFLTISLVGAMLAGCGSSDSSQKADAGSSQETGVQEQAAADTAETKKDGAYDLTLYTINSTDEDFPEWLANVEGATGLKINVIAAPTDSDTRQQKITTILSTGDASVDILEINDEMSASFISGLSSRRDIWQI